MESYSLPSSPSAQTRCPLVVTYCLKGSSLLMRADKEHADFVIDYLVPSFMKLRDALRRKYPSLFVIMGNDERHEESEILKAAEHGLWSYVHGRKAMFAGFNVYGYAVSRQLRFC
jgi:hypothetical protein